MPAANLPGWNIGNTKFYKTIIIKPHGMIFARPRHTWDIKMNIVERVCEGVK
jgi:hypothetical protein